MDDPMVTEELIHALSRNGSMTAVGAAYIGMRFPLSKGWRKRVVGKPRTPLRSARKSRPVVGYRRLSCREIRDMEHMELLKEYADLIDVAIDPLCDDARGALQCACRVRNEIHRRDT